MITLLERVEDRIVSSARRDKVKLYLNKINGIAQLH